ncbi:hypothetical protein MO973_13050 [Paenibacillus sp. TRM 82003]|nr:hypothetical protein [Paenibacillus sp. TRM 82003]
MAAFLRNAEEIRIGGGCINDTVYQLRQTTRFDLPFRYPNMKNGLRWIRHFLK